MTNFYYDPAKQGYTTTDFKTLSGVPAISGSVLRLNTAVTIHLGDIYKCDLAVHALVPAVPTAGDVRYIGFSNMNMGAELGFNFVDDTLMAVATDTAGNTTTETILFDDSWFGAEAIFEILWHGPVAIFKINGTQVAKLNDIAVPKTPMSLMLDNTNADNMDIIGVEFKNIETYK